MAVGGCRACGGGFDSCLADFGSRDSHSKSFGEVFNIIVCLAALYRIWTNIGVLDALLYSKLALYCGVYRFKCKRLSIRPQIENPFPGLLELARGSKGSRGRLAIAPALGRPGPLRKALWASPGRGSKRTLADTTARYL